MLPFIIAASSNSTNNSKNDMSTNKYIFSITTSNKGPLNIPLKEGNALFVLGANGVGKSTLMQNLFQQNPNHSKRILAHRQTWIPDNSMSMTATQKKQTEQAIKVKDRDINTRYRDDYSGSRAIISIFDLINSENVRNRNIANAVDNKSIKLALAHSEEQAPIDAINEIFAMSNIPIVITTNEIQELFASKNGSPPYSISELSDGERNALLISADVLTTKPNHLIILDEPERHLHRSIISPLLTSLFQKKENCVFVISTHDVNLPIDHKKASVLLLRDCQWSGKSILNWDADLIKETESIPFEIKESILGSKRDILFVEGESQSLDRQIYQLIFPNLTIIPKGDCRQVQKAVEGIKGTENLHWINAYGLIDADDRTTEQIQILLEKRVVALDCYSVESLYYNLEIVERVANRYGKAIGDDAKKLLEKASSSIINNIKDDRDRLCSILCEKRVRNEIMSNLPNNKDILKEKEIKLDFKTKDFFEKEKSKFDDFVKNKNLNGLISRYPLKKTKVISGIVTGLGMKRENYESTVRQLIIEDLGTKEFFKNNLLSKLTELMFPKEDKIDVIVVKEPKSDSKY